jgi:hypothetical protein
VGKRLWLGCVALAALAAFASTARAITNGTVDGTAHPNVGALYATAQGHPTPTLFCSGSLVAPGVFLTAAHCITAIAAAPDPHYFVSFSPTPDPSKLIEGTPVVDPLFTGKGATDPNDLAVIRFDARARAAAGIAPVSLAPVGFLDTLLAGNASPLFLDVGYGLTDIAATRDGIRRDAYSGDPHLKDGTWLVLSQDAKKGFGGTCTGDSGGPQFAGTLEVSITITGDADCTKRGQNLRLDTAAARSFLAPFLSR